MSSSRTDLSNILYQKEIDAEQFNIQDRRFKIDIEYLQESSSAVDPSKDLVIQSKKNNIIITTEESKSINLYGNTVIHENLSVANVTMTSDASFNSNVDISNMLTVHGKTTLNSQTDISNLEILNNLTVQKDASFNNKVDISNHLTVHGDVSINTNIGSYI